MTYMPQADQGHKTLSQNSSSSLLMTSLYFIAALSNVSDAEALSFSTDCKEGKCSTLSL